MLYSFWIILVLLGLGTTGLGTFRLIRHFEDADYIDVIFLAIGFVVNLIVALNASALALEGTSTGLIENYSGMAVFTLPFFGISLFSVLMVMIAIIRGFLQVKELRIFAK